MRRDAASAPSILGRDARGRRFEAGKDGEGARPPSLAPTGIAKRLETRLRGRRAHAARRTARASSVSPPYLLCERERGRARSGSRREINERTKAASVLPSLALALLLRLHEDGGAGGRGMRLERGAHAPHTASGPKSSPRAKAAGCEAHIERLRAREKDVATAGRGGADAPSFDPSSPGSAALLLHPGWEATHDAVRGDGADDPGSTDGQAREKDVVTARKGSRRTDARSRCSSPGRILMARARGDSTRVLGVAGRGRGGRGGRGGLSERADNKIDASGEGEGKSSGSEGSICTPEVHSHRARIRPNASKQPLKIGFLPGTSICARFARADDTIPSWHVDAREGQRARAAPSPLRAQLPSPSPLLTTRCGTSPHRSPPPSQALHVRRARREPALRHLPVFSGVFGSSSLRGARTFVGGGRQIFASSHSLRTAARHARKIDTQDILLPFLPSKSTNPIRNPVQHPAPVFQFPAGLARVVIKNHQSVRQRTRTGRGVVDARSERRGTSLLVWRAEKGASTSMAVMDAHAAPAYWLRQRESGERRGHAHKDGVRGPDGVAKRNDSLVERVNRHDQGGDDERSLCAREPRALSQLAVEISERGGPVQRQGIARRVVVDRDIVVEVDQKPGASPLMSPL
ncbi:hypothetical protein C8R47DRAFT_1072085 [Mycena vitilis]|nr:hypothetical protein C8R47DRAFT_1072085 [Mycena vitilis]